MERRNFFKKLGIGAATIVIAPKILDLKDLTPKIEAKAVQKSTNTQLHNVFDEPYGATFQKIKVTQSPNINGFAGSVHLIGFDNNLISRLSVVIPPIYIEHTINKHFPAQFLILGKEDNGLYKIASYASDVILKHIPIGTELIVWGQPLVAKTTNPPLA